MSSSVYVLSEPNEIATLLAQFLNYLNVSFYEGQMTQKHEEARANLNAIYDAVSKTPNEAPRLDQCVSFYNDILALRDVTYTNDPDYYTYTRKLRNYIEGHYHRGAYP